MSTLWVLGNSFSFQRQDSKDYTWIKQIADSLNFDLVNLSQVGASLDHIFETFNNQRKCIQLSDIVVITFTDIDRRWLFRDQPTDGVWRHIDKEHPHFWIWENDELVQITRDEPTIDAINLYLDHLNNIAAYDAYYKNFLHNLNYFAKNVHTIILPCFEGVSNYLNDNKSLFPNLHIANKSIMTLSRNEFKDNEFYYSGIMRFNPDPRPNHLVYSNHVIMKDKIINNIKKKEPLFFNTGFLENFLTCDDLRDQNFCDKEMFAFDLAKFYARFDPYWIHISRTGPESHASVKLPR